MKTGKVLARMDLEKMSVVWSARFITCCDVRLFVWICQKHGLYSIHACLCPKATAISAVTSSYMEDCPFHNKHSSIEISQIPQQDTLIHEAIHAMDIRPLGAITRLTVVVTEAIDQRTLAAVKVVS